MGRLYFMADGDEMVRRRARVPKGSVVEAWADRRGGAAFWVGEDSRRLLDEAGERPMAVRLSLPDDAVPGATPAVLGSLRHALRRESLAPPVDESDRVVLQPSTELARYVDLAVLRGAYARYRARPSEDDALAVWRAVTLALWLEQPIPVPSTFSGETHHERRPEHPADQGTEVALR